MRALIDPDDPSLGPKPDVSDLASAHEQLNLAAALRRVQREQREQPVLPATGECLYCGADLSGYFADGLRWCPAEPGEDPEQACVRLWEREQERRRANG